MFTAALRYVQHGIPIFPLHTPTSGACDCSRGARCSSPGKHPRTANGVLAATTDPAQIRSWWVAHPEANIGIATGARSGLLVCDVDGPLGARSLERRHLPPTAVVETGREGGLHYFFEYPGGHIRNRAGLLERVDLRGNGGYVVAPPSLHASGRRYRWVPQLTPKTVGFARPPAWLLDLLRKPGVRQPTRSSEEWRALAANGVREGERHSSLCSLAGKVFRSNLDQVLGCELLHAWNHACCRPPLPHGEAEKVISDIRGREDATRQSQQAPGSRFPDLAVTRRLTE